jgi:hypothetical protein
MSELAKYSVLRPPHLLTSSFKNLLRSDLGHDFARLCDLFPTSWRIYVMGGVVRNLMLERMRGIKVAPADADLVVDGASSIEALRARMGPFYLSANEFGGAKCRLQSHGTVFDVWRIEDHTNMALATRPHTVEQLLRHNLLDVDAIVWEPRTDCLHDCGCRAAIEAGCIDLMGEAGISPRFLAAHAAHIIVVAYKTGLPISDRALDFVKSVCDLGERLNVIRSSQGKLPEAANAIDAFLDELLKGAVRLWPSRTNR